MKTMRLQLQLKLVAVAEAVKAEPAKKAPRKKELLLQGSSSGRRIK